MVEKWSAVPAFPLAGGGWKLILKSKKHKHKKCHKEQEDEKKLFCSKKAPKRS